MPDDIRVDLDAEREASLARQADVRLTARARRLLEHAGFTASEDDLRRVALEDEIAAPAQLELTVERALQIQSNQQSTTRRVEVDVRNTLTAAKRREVVEFAARKLKASPAMTARDLVAAVNMELGLKISLHSWYTTYSKRAQARAKELRGVAERAETTSAPTHPPVTPPPNRVTSPAHANGNGAAAAAEARAIASHAAGHPVVMVDELLDGRIRVDVRLVADAQTAYRLLAAAAVVLSGDSARNNEQAVAP